MESLRNKNRNNYKRIPASEDAKYFEIPSSSDSPSRFHEDICFPNTQEVPIASMNYFTSTRFRIAILLLVAMMAKDMMSSNLAYAIPCMVNSSMQARPHPRIMINSSATVHCTQSHANETRSYHGTIPWNSAKQGLLFSAFDWGYALIFFVGTFVDHLNPKYLVIFSTLLSFFATIVSPLTAVNSFSATVFLRAALGFGNAILNPAVNTLTATWFPEDERNTAYAISTAGDQISAMIISALSGIFCGISWIGGWPLIFYFSAAVALIFVMVWVVYAANSPQRHPWINPEELHLLTKKLAIDNAETIVSEDRIHKRIPYRQILTSPAVWATVCGTVGHEFPLIMLSLYLPTYLKNVLDYSMSENGWIGVLPKITFLVVKIFASAFADFLQQRFKCSKTVLAKVLNTLGCIGVGSTLLGTTFLSCEHRSFSTVLLVLSQALAGLQVPGALGTLVSIAPRFTGTICGLAYSIVALLSIIGPIAVGEVVASGTKDDWNKVFYAIAAIAFLPVIVFNIWGTAKIQRWARQDEDEEILIKD